MYHLIELTTYNNGTADAKGIYSYDTENEAVANFHQKMGGAMKNENYETELLIVINSDGGIIKDEKFDRGTVAQEESEEEA